MVVWIKMQLSMEVGLGPGDFVLVGDPAPLPQSPNSQFIQDSILTHWTQKST